MKIVALGGGVGGAKLAHGLSKILSPDELTIIVNTGDDFNHFGLYISPDLDTICYTLSERANVKTGWGRNEDSFNVLEEIRAYGGPDWFTLGDKDIALHMERTRLMQNGLTLTQASLKLETMMGLKHKILPMSNEKVSTIVHTNEYANMSFQDYFVSHKFQPVVKGFTFEGIKKAIPAHEAITALEESEAIIICPSNPFVSINPIIALDNIREILQNKYVVAVSPIVGGKAVRGPLGKMLAELGYEVHPSAIIDLYKDFLDCIFVDMNDQNTKLKNNPSGIIIKVENILLPDIKTRMVLAKNIINHINKRK